MKKIVFFIILIFSVNSFAKDFKIGDDTICSGVESTDKFKALIGLGISKEEAYAKIRGCRAIKSKSKSYMIGKNTICSDAKSKSSFETLLKVGYDENFAYKKVPNCHPYNANIKTNRDMKTRKMDKIKFYNLKSKSIYFKNSKHRALSESVPKKCFTFLPTGNYYYYVFEYGNNHELIYTMEKSPRKNPECPKYLIEKK